MASMERPPRAPSVVPQPSGMLGWLTGLFGASTPRYAGEGHRAAPSSGGLFGGTPVYRLAPSLTATPGAVPAPAPASPSGAPDEGDLHDGATWLRPVAVIVRRESVATCEETMADAVTE